MLMLNLIVKMKSLQMGIMKIQTLGNYLPSMMELIYDPLRNIYFII